MPQKPDTVSLPIGAAAPDFDLPSVAGGRVRLGDFADARVFVYVQGCNHCPVLRAYVDRLASAARDDADRGVAYVMVNSNDAERYPDDSFEEMQRFAHEQELPFPYLHDRDQEVARAYRTVRTPEVLVFDEARMLRYHGRIDDAKDPEAVTRQDLREAVAALLAGEEVTEPETWAVGCTVKWKPGRSPHEA